MTRVLLSPDSLGQAHGGISRYTYELHRRLPEFGIASTLFAGAYLSDLRSLTKIGLPVSRHFSGRRQLNDLLFATYSALPHFRILHKTYAYGASSLLARGPLVVTVHDLIHALMPEFFPGDRETVSFHRRYCRHADLILAVSERTKCDLIDVFGVPPEKIMVTHLGVSVASASVQAQNDSGRPYFLYVGRRTAHKNWKTLVRAFGASPELRNGFYLVCVGGGSFTGEEQRLLDKFSLTERVILRRNVDDRQLDGLYRRAVGFVYPSFYEGFGLPPLEAMARGCPVAASSGGSIPEVVGQAALLFSPHEPSEVAAALMTMAFDESRRGLLREAGINRACTFTWDNTAAATARAYLELV